MESSKAEAQLALIRAEIERYGQSIVPCGKLLVLVSPKAPIRSQFDHIFAVAEKENWTLEFQPDGTVRFANIEARDGQNSNVVETAEELTPRASARTLR